MAKTGTRTIGAVAAATMVAAAALASLVPAGAADEGGANRATATLIDAGGKDVGRVIFKQVGGGVVRVTANVAGLSGFHGFHIHAGSTCRDASGNPDFGLAAGHLGHDASAGVHHRDHPGDMPVLLAKNDGTATATFETTRATVGDIKGRTVIVHALADNYANIPTTRYGAVDNTTLTTGDAGNRLACGAIRSGG